MRLPCEVRQSQLSLLLSCTHRDSTTDATKKFRSNIYSFHFVRILLGLHTCFICKDFSYFLYWRKNKFFYQAILLRFPLQNSETHFLLFSFSLSRLSLFADKSIPSKFQYKQNQWFRNIQQNVSMNVKKSRKKE